ncbi:glycosyltransferase [Marinobacter pelagius]|nr:glycosyltransferase [Marinobacter pelagius]
MKVLHLIDSGGLYGAENLLLTLVREQMKSGLSPMILSAGDPRLGEKELETEARHQGLPVMCWRMKPGLNLLDARKIYRWAQKEGFEVMHSHGYKFNVLMGIWPESIRKIPLVTTLHGYVHAPFFTKAWFYESVDRLALGRMRQVVLVSNAMKSQVPGAIGRSPKVTVIPNGLDASRIIADANAALPENIQAFIRIYSPLLLGVGRLAREKGFDCLISAFEEVKRSFPSAGLLLIGEGSQRASLERQIHELGLDDAVMMPGYLSNVPSIMQRSNVLCMPSLTEGLPITLLEAMTVGLPIVASDVGEISKVLGAGKGGRVIRAETQGSLAKEVISVLQESEQNADRARWARHRIEKYYSSHAMAEKYLQVYQRAVA